MCSGRCRDIDVDIDRYFVCFKGVPKSVQVLSNCLEAVMVLTLTVLKHSKPLQVTSRFGPLQVFVWDGFEV